MGKMLIAYASKTGTTADVAAILAKRLAGAVDLVDMVDLNDVKRSQRPNLHDYKTVVLGTAMYMGKPLRAMAAYCKANEAALAEKQLYLFTCGIAGEAEELTYLKKTLPQSLTARALCYRHLGGELRLNRMSPFARFAMGRFLKANEQPPTLDAEAIEALCQTIVNGVGE